MSATEGTVREWRLGTVQAERMCAALLHLEAYEDIDPQHPLGGPDGLKDVLCKKGGKTWVAAAYFPPTHPSFKEIETKFIHDFAGVKDNGATAFAFFVNQALTIGEREELRSKAGETEVEIYHLERIRELLDSPKGCGIRLEYLRIPMSMEEQVAFWSVMNCDVVQKLSENEIRHNVQLNAVHDKLDKLLMRTTAIEPNLRAHPSSLMTPTRTIEAVEMPTASFTVAIVCWIHRILTEDQGLPEVARGHFRVAKVWIGPAGSTQESATFLPPPPDDVPTLLDDLLDWWHELHPKLVGATKNEVAAGLAELHHRFLSIHPFLDANGRVARSITDQAARELLDEGIGREFVEDSATYYEALQAADKGDLAPLTQRMIASLA